MTLPCGSRREPTVSREAAVASTAARYDRGAGAVHRTAPAKPRSPRCRTARSGASFESDQTKQKVSSSTAATTGEKYRDGVAIMRARCATASWRMVIAMASIRRKRSTAAPPRRRDTWSRSGRAGYLAHPSGNMAGVGGASGSTPVGCLRPPSAKRRLFSLARSTSYVPSRNM